MEHVIINGKKFKKGYTTGTCATAVAKAVTLMLFSNASVENIEVSLPGGKNITIKLTDVELKGDMVICSCVKDGGDDPDVTHGIKIFAKGKKISSDGVVIRAGIGIGVVTKPGLSVEIGQPAINPVPRKMIEDAVLEVLPKGCGVEIEIFIPNGEEIAKKTYNPRLGIVGGISILGTTGIVEPMSEEAWKEALAIEISQAKALGYKDIIFVFGNYGEEYVINEYGVSKEKIIVISNFVGFMLNKAVEMGIERVLVVGHMGKILKIAGGIFHTLSSVADGRMEILTCYAGLEGANRETLKRIFECSTTDAAVEVIKEVKLEKVFDRIASAIKDKSEQYVHNGLEVGAIIFDGKRSILSQSDNAQKILSRIR